MITIFKKLLRDESGTSAIEMGLICSLIILAMMGGLSALGGGSAGMWTRLSNTVNSSM